MKCNYCDKDKPERMFNKRDLNIGKCRECNSKCEHGKRKTMCKECGGGSICKHKTYRNVCIICSGCSHNKIKRFCIDCDGVSTCPHNKIKRFCIDCDGSRICKHKLRVSRCKDCDGTEICKHNKRLHCCIICNPIDVFISRQRVYIRDCLQGKNRGTNEYIGCDKVFLFNHIKSQMKDNMTFKNIHIDHIKPISKFDLTKEEEIKKCFHWSNLQPLLIEDNLSKSNKWSDKEEEHWKNNIIKI